MGSGSEPPGHEVSDEPERADEAAGERFIDLRFFRGEAPDDAVGPRRAATDVTEHWSDELPEASSRAPSDGALLLASGHWRPDDAPQRGGRGAPLRPEPRATDVGTAVDRPPVVTRQPAPDAPVTTSRPGRHKRSAAVPPAATSLASPLPRYSPKITSRHPAAAPDRRRITLTAVALVGAIAVVATVVAVLTRSDSPDVRAGSTAVPTTQSLSAEAEAWLRYHVTLGTPIAVPAAARKEIGRSHPGLPNRSYADAMAEPADLLVVPARSARERSDALQRLYAGSEPVAVFSDGSQVRQVVAEGTPAQARAERRRMGRQLTTDNRIRLSPGAWASLTAGDVDPRLMGLLLRVANVHRIDVFSFPRHAPERGARAPAREMHITAVDGQLVAEGKAAAEQVQVMMRGLPEPYAPAEIRKPYLMGAPDGILVRFKLPTEQ